MNHHTEDKRIALVTGGGGFIGQYLIADLLANGWKVRNLDFIPGPIADNSLSHWQGSFLNYDLLREALTGVDCVFHLASTHFPKDADANPKADCEGSIVANIGLSEISISLGVRRLIYASSGGTVYGTLKEVPADEEHSTRPITAYGISKLASENYFRYFDKKGLETLSLRIANPYGPGQNLKKSQGALTTFCYNSVNNIEIAVWGDGAVERDFVHVRDVSKAFLLAADSPCRGTEINIGCGKGASLNDIIHNIEAILKKEVRRQYFPSRSFDVPKSVLCIKKARELLGWSPSVGLKEGIKEVLDAFLNKRI